jgi:hypothetical protein
MGAWGPGLYQDDEARDLRNAIALLARIPADGDRILDILLGQQPKPPGLGRDGGPTFWLVVADQFERKGIRCDRAFRTAMQVIEDGEDIRDLESRDMAERDLRKRARVLVELKGRLESPRAPRPRSNLRRPSMVVSPGEVFVFPTMGGMPINPWSSRERPMVTHGGSFAPDGWGSLLILETTRAYDWFPVCTYVPLATPPEREATLADARQARVASNVAKQGVPRAQQLKRTQARSIGQLPLSAPAVASFPISPEARSVEWVAYAGWAVSAGWAPGRTDAVRVTDILSG